MTRAPSSSSIPVSDSSIVSGNGAVGSAAIGYSIVSLAQQERRQADMISRHDALEKLRVRDGVGHRFELALLTDLDGVPQGGGSFDQHQSVLQENRALRVQFQ